MLIRVGEHIEDGRCGCGDVDPGGLGPPGAGVDDLCSGAHATNPRLDDVSVRVYTGPHSNRGGGPSGWITYLPWGFAALTILGQIVWVLVGDQSRTALSILTVVTFFLASASHAFLSRGAGWAAAFLGISLGFGWFIERLGLATSFPFGTYEYSSALGLTIAGVPVVIPLAWAMMAYPCLLGRPTAVHHGPRHRPPRRLAAGRLGPVPRPPDGGPGLLDVGGRRLGASRDPRDPAAELPRVVPQRHGPDVAAGPPAAQGGLGRGSDDTADLGVRVQHPGEPGVLRSARRRDLGRRGDGTRHGSVPLAICGASRHGDLADGPLAGDREHADRRRASPCTRQ